MQQLELGETVIDCRLNDYKNFFQIVINKLPILYKMIISPTIQIIFSNKILHIINKLRPRITEKLVISGIILRQRKPKDMRIDTKI